MKILFLSDFDIKGSGYSGISTNLCGRLAKDYGHEVKAIGLAYDGSEHFHPFSIIPCVAFQEAQTMLNNMKWLWQPDVVIVALDIPHQNQYISLAKQLEMKYVVITPLESEPLSVSWAGILSQSDKSFFISKLGSDEAKKAGLDAEHLQVGIDTQSWRLRTKEEYEAARNMIGIPEDAFVVLTVADNQERKNLSKAMEIVGEFKRKTKRKVRHILVTREFSPVGWNLRDYAMEVGTASETLIFEKGLDFKKLYSIYCMADAFLLTSKGEGLGLPVMEAMSVGIPVVATKTGALSELLADGRGYLLDIEYTTIDPFGNQTRKFPFTKDGVTALEEIADGKSGKIKEAARKYMETRTWDIPVRQLHDALEKLNEKDA